MVNLYTISLTNADNVTVFAVRASTPARAVLRVLVDRPDTVRHFSRLDVVRVVVEVDDEVTT